MSLRCNCARGEDLSFRSNLMYFTGLIKLAYLGADSEHMRVEGDAWKGIGKREGKRGGMLAVFTIHQSQSNAFRCWFAVNVIIPFIKFHYHWPWHGLPQLRLASWFGRVSKPIREASGTAVCPRAWFESLSSEIECNDNTLVNSVPIPFPIHVRAILATITRYSFFIPVFFRTPHFPLPFHQIIPTSHAPGEF